MPDYFLDPSYWKVQAPGRLITLVLAVIILGHILWARRGRRLFIRRIAGLGAIDEAVGRATEMGRPLHFSLGLGSLGIITIQALAIAIHVIRLSIRFRNRVILTMSRPDIYAVAEEAVREAYQTEGRPEAFAPDDVRFLTDRQFAYAAAAVGIINREQVASNFMFGEFFAESLILAEAGNMVGAIQVAGTPTITQIPFFVTACDYVIIGDEYFAGTAYLTRDPVLLGSVVGQDRAKLVAIALIALGILFATVFTVAGNPAIVDSLSKIFTEAQTT
jgi:hypothetical protein